MMVIPQAALVDLQRYIVDAAQYLTDTSGERVILSTIDADSIKTAALVALTVITGEVIWPGGEKLKLRERRPSYGAVEIER